MSWEKVQPFLQVSPFAFQYHRKRDLCLRAMHWEQLFDPVLPGIFLAWAKRNDIPYPEELEKRVAAHGHQISDWKSNFDKMKKMYDELKEAYTGVRSRWDADRAALSEVTRERDALAEETQRLRQAMVAKGENKDLGGKERQTAMKLIVGMAVHGYRFDPLSTRSAVFAEIASDLHLTGVPLDEDTVRKWVRNAAELLPSPALQDIAAESAIQMPTFSDFQKRTCALRRPPIESPFRPQSRLKAA